MVPFHFEHVCIESYALNLPTRKIPSAELEQRLAPVYERLQIPFGTLEKISGVSSRYFWPEDVYPSIAGTVAAERALEGIGFGRENVKALFSCAVTRDYFEPSTACLLHKNLKMDESAIVMDISNACLGFSDGLMMLGSLIETGVVPAGVVVSAETIARCSEALMRHLLSNPDLGRDDLLKLLPSLTLGSGAVAYVLCHDSIATKKHKLLGGVSRAATDCCDLCIGNGDYYLRQNEDFNPIMETESSKLIAAAARLGGRTWKDASEHFGWKADDIDHIVCHQVGKQVNDAFYKEMGLQREKEFTIYQEYGNLVSAALPTAFAMAIEQKGIKKGDKILLTGFGSGLNSMFSAIEW